MKRARVAAPKLVVFLGPSLDRNEAKRLAPDATFLSPARQGDVWRALETGPRAIVLIDGVFEAQPSVWHHELIAALDAGVAVFGASSMGALRAAELDAYGMIGVGRIYERYRKGAADDADVALLHADAEHGFRPLTVPLVNVLHAVELAQRAKALRGPDAKELVRAARSLHYQERTWPALLRAAKWSRPARAEAFRAFLEKTRPDLKADDARECLKLAAGFVKKNPEPDAPRLPPSVPSALVRRRRLSLHAGQIERLAQHRDAQALIDAGLRRSLLASWARSRGVRARPEDLATARREWLESLAPRTVEDLGLDEGQIAALMEDLVLERFVLDHAERWLSDGPNAAEALASEARLAGRWRRTP